MGRTRPLTIHGLGYTLERVKALLDLYGWSEWPGFFPVDFHPLPAQELTLALDCSDFSIHTSPVCHGIPNIGLRITLKGSGRVIGYSCDTAPCEQTVRLGSGADVLIHEAGGDFAGHSSAQQAGEIARQAEVGRLILIHYPSGRFAAADLIEQARSSFTGDVTLAKDMMTLT